MRESIGEGCFCLSRDILHPKSRAGDAVGNGWWNIGRTFREISSPFGRVTRQEGIFVNNSGRPILHALNQISFVDSSIKALCLDVFVTGVFRVRIEMIVIDGKLTTEVIHRKALSSRVGRISAGSAKKCIIVIWPINGWHVGM
jgi:hypothetical protein